MALPVSVTLLYGGLNVLLNWLLGANTSRVRGKYKQFVGDPPSDEVVRASRAHGNNTEWMVVGILLLLVLELAGAPALSLHLFGGAILATRVLHAVGVLGKNGLSTAGAGLTYLLMPVMAGYAVYLHFR